MLHASLETGNIFGVTLYLHKMHVLARQLDIWDFKASFWQILFKMIQPDSFFAGQCVTGPITILSAGRRGSYCRDYLKTGCYFLPVNNAAHSTDSWQSLVEHYGAWQLAMECWCTSNVPLMPIGNLVLLPTNSTSSNEFWLAQFLWFRWRNLPFPNMFIGSFVDEDI